MINGLHCTFAIILTSAGLVMLISMLVAAIWCIKHGGRFGSNCMSEVPPEPPFYKCPPAISADLLEEYKRELKRHYEIFDHVMMAGDKEDILVLKQSINFIKQRIIDLENANDKDHSADS